MRTYLRGILVGLPFAAALATFALCRTGATPERVVHNALTAFLHNDARLASLASPTGHMAAEFFCGGSLATCLQQAYAGLGTLESASTVELAQADGKSRVQLRSAWSGLRPRVCQDFFLEKQANSWQITYVDAAREC